MHTHAALPFADRIEGDIYRIYFSTRDTKNRASLAYIKVDIRNPKKILYLAKKPVLSQGAIGTFDDSGVMGSCLVNYKNKKFLYYTGWNIGTTVPFHWSIGLAISNDGGRTFEKYSEAPIFDRSDTDPLFVASPTVILENGIWKMWYISSMKWEIHNGKPRAPYHIKYAESKNGINWKREDIICIDLRNKEVGVGRASVIKENGIYHMWYSYATDRYGIGYANSKDGIHWSRKDHLAGIGISKSGWDSQSIEYSFVFEHKGTRYMLYNGNDYGKTGFGYAVLDKNVSVK